MSILADARPTVMIVSDDATGAALLGGLVETFGYRVEFAEVRESSETVRRIKPRVCLLDCESEACSQSVIARTLMRGVSVVLVGPRALLDGMRELAARFDVPIVFSPPEVGPLGEVLDRAVRSS
jgi:CheY-like chemotaxis protein